METKHTTDVVIIGAGPVGLFAIFQLGMLKITCHVVDTLDFTGGQCTALYPEKPIYDIPGYPMIEAAALIEKLEEQARPFAPVFHLGQQVMRLTKEGDHWKVITSKNIEIKAKAVIIAAGCGAFGPNRPPLDGIESYEGKSVFYLVRKREDFRGKRVVIAGGGDSAVDWILSLQEVAERISVIHRRPKFRAAPESVARVEKLAKEGKIDLVIPYQLDGLKGKNGALEAVIVKDLDNQTKEIPADVLLPFFGLAMELGPIAEWGLNLEENRISVNPKDCQTNIPGIFAIGDINHYAGKLKLILCGFAESASAAHAIYPLVYPNQALHFEYSTSRGVPA